MLFNSNPKLIHPNVFEKAKTIYNHLKMKVDVTLKPIERVGKYLGYTNQRLDVLFGREFDILLWEHKYDDQLLLATIAHELVHVDQVVSGRLLINNAGDKTWVGQYYDSACPWETEAEIISNKIIEELFPEIPLLVH